MVEVVIAPLGIGAAAKFQSLVGIICSCNRLGWKPLLYLVFEVQFRQSTLKVPFQPPSGQFS